MPRSFSWGEARSRSTFRSNSKTSNWVLYCTSLPPVAQLVEQLPFKETVAGSIPAGRTRIARPPGVPCLRTARQGSNAGAMPQKLLWPRGGAQPECADGRTRGAGDSCHPELPSLSEPHGVASDAFRGERRVFYRETLRRFARTRLLVPNILISSFCHAAYCSTYFRLGG